MSNTLIQPKSADAYTVNMDDMVQMTSTGVGSLRAMSNPESVDVDAVVAKANDIMKKYQNIAKTAAGDEVSVFSPKPKKMDEYDMKVNTDIEKRVKDNIRDESKVERPFEFDKLKSFQKTKAGLLLKMKAVKSLLDQTKDRNSRNQLHYLQAEIARDLSKISAMEGGDWVIPKMKQDSDPDKDHEKFMKPENTKPKINPLNDMIQKASFEAWSAPESLKKKAAEEMSSTQKTNIEQAISELSKNDEKYCKDIEMLEQKLGKKSGVNMVVAKEDVEPEDKPAEDKDSDEPKKDKDEKDEKKEDGKKDKKDKDKKKGKEDIKERMKKIREKIKSRKPSVPDDISNDRHEEGKDVPTLPKSPESPPMDRKQMSPIKDDLTAVFNRSTTKHGSYWEIFDGQNNPVMKFTGADAWGKKLFKEWNSFSSKPYGSEIIARIRRDGIVSVAKLLNAKYKMTRHAMRIESLAKIKNIKKRFKVSQKMQRPVFAKQKLYKKAKTNPKEVLNKYFQKFDDATGKGYGKSWISLYKNKATQAQTKVKDLEKKVAEMEKLLDSTKEAKVDLQNEKKLRIRAEKAVRLATQMMDKGFIKKESIEDTVEKLTVMDDISYNMMEDWTNKNNGIQEKVSEAREKKACKVTSGINHVILQASKEAQTIQEKLTNAFMSKPKYAKLQELKDKAFSSKV